MSKICVDKAEYFRRRTLSVGRIREAIIDKSFISGDEYNQMVIY